MKKITSTFLLLILLGCSGADQVVTPINTEVPITGVIGHWNFNGTLKDESGYGHHLTGINIEDSLYLICAISNDPEALELYGPAGTEKTATTQYAELDVNLSTLFEMDTSGFSIEVRVALFAERGHLVNKYDHSGLYGWSIQFNGWQLTLVLGDGDQRIYQAGVSITDSLFHDYKAVVDRENDEAWLYIDGVKSNNSPIDISATSGSLVSPTSPRNLMVGLIATSGPFEGIIEEIKISK